MNLDVQNEINEELWISALRSSDLRKALSTLPRNTQRLIYLRFCESMTIEEIAKEMRMSWDAVDHAIETALASLRKVIIGENSNKSSANGAA